MLLKNARIYSIHFRKERDLYVNITFWQWIVEFIIDVFLFNFFAFVIGTKQSKLNHWSYLRWKILVSLWCTSLFPTFISWLTKDSGKSTAKKDMWRPCGRLLLTLSSNLLLQKFSVYLKSQVCVLKLLEWMFWSIKRIKTAYLNSLKLHSFP